MRQIQSAPPSRRLQKPEETDRRYVRPAEFLAFIPVRARTAGPDKLMHSYPAGGSRQSGMRCLARVWVAAR
jgi:hypothetical protein